jgi:hypothetical protein
MNRGAIYIYYSSLSWFMTRFESRGAPEYGEYCHARDMRVYIGSGLREDKKLCPVCIGVL